MKSIAAVILAAGQGTRMKSKLAKVLHPIAGREMILHILDAVREAGVQRVVVVGPETSPLQELLGDAAEYAVQAEALGTGHALAQARPLVESTVEDVLALYGDTPLLTVDTLRAVIAAHQEAEAALTLLTAVAADPEGLGRVLRDALGCIWGVIEEAEADAAQRAIAEINVGVYCFRSSWLWDELASLPRSPKGEYYLTHLVGRAVAAGQRVATVLLKDSVEALGVNTRVQLAQAEAVLRGRIRERLMLSGVTIIDPPSTFIDATVEIGQDTIIYPHSFIGGKTRIGQDCQVGPSSVITDSHIGDNCRVLASVMENATIQEGVDVGPFSHLRPGAHLEAGVHIGNFAEVKNSRLGQGTKMGHFSYIGDAKLGRDVNVGAGTITCNFDGVLKHRTEIGDEVFLGSDTLLIAPVSVGDRALTAAGSVINRDVPPDTAAIGAPARHRPKTQRIDVAANQ